MQLAPVVGAASLAQGSWGEHMWGWGGWWMALGMLVFWGVIVGLVVVLVRAVAGDGGRQRPREQDRAEQILAERFARGEIDADEFRERQRALRSSS